MGVSPSRLFALLLVPTVVACQCVSLEGALFECGEGESCPAGLRCAPAGDPQAGLCVPLGGVDGGGGGGGSGGAGGSGGGGIPPGVRAVDLVFDNADGGSLDAFPLLVALDSAVIDYAAVSNPASELRFVDADTGQDLPFQVEAWNPGGESALWVLVPNIAAARTDDFITLYFGAGAGGSADPTGYGVFGSYVGVWHLGAGPQLNSAGPPHRGTTTGGVGAPGRIGSALKLSGSGDQRVLFDGGTTLFDGWNSFSLELWVRPDYASLSAVTAEGGVLDKGGSLNLGRVFRTATPSLSFQVDMHFEASPNDTYLGTDLPLQQWTWIAYTFDGKALTLYSNGVADGRETFATTTRMRSGPNDFFLGDSSGPINGAIDEVRISRVAHRPDWIRAQYRAMTRRFVTFRPR